VLYLRRWAVHHVDPVPRIVHTGASYDAFATWFGAPDGHWLYSHHYSAEIHAALRPSSTLPLPALTVDCWSPHVPHTTVADDFGAGTGRIFGRCTTVDAVSPTLRFNWTVWPVICHHWTTPLLTELQHNITLPDCSDFPWLLATTCVALLYNVLITFSLRRVLRATATPSPRVQPRAF